MSGSVTPNFRLLKPPFDGIPWDQAVNGNMDIIDAALAQYLTIANFVGVWKNATAYVVGQVTIDAADSTFWRCLVAHTSPASPSTFAQDRAGITGRWTPTVPSGTNNAGSSNAGRNLIRNSRMGVFQRGVGPFTSTAPSTYTVAYTADGWRYESAFDTISVAVGGATDTMRQQVGDESMTQYLNVTFTGSSNTLAYSIISQPIEGVRRLAGKSITVSFWAATTASMKLGVRMSQYFGGLAGASPSVITPAVTVTLTGTHVRYSATFNMPSVVGKTLSGGNDCTVLQLAFTSGATNNASVGGIGVQSGSFDIWGVQVEIGTATTALEMRSIQLEVSDCQRHFTTFNQVLCATSYAAAPNADIWLDLTLPVRMRAVPYAVTFSNITYSNASGLVLNQSGFDNLRFSIRSSAAGEAWAAFDTQIAAEI